ncbi:ChaB family protein [Antrihabitans spumae]|uniref:ChaB family protein n=1 Tax=Antrihabitans spumae TaxID=3373370 RepID=A0ABW7K9H8_9NOCA
MAKTAKSGKAKKSELPGTLRRSSDKAQRTFAKAHDSAVKEYGEGEQAHRVAFAALKHTYEKIGDHWEKKAKRGPSDERAESGGPNAKGETAEGVDANATKEHLRGVAKRLDIKGRSTMKKAELVTAIKEANRRASAKK